jgi:hypothetical protein
LSDSVVATCCNNDPFIIGEASYFCYRPTPTRVDESFELGFIYSGDLGALRFTTDLDTLVSFFLKRFDAKGNSLLFAKSNNLLPF